MREPARYRFGRFELDARTGELSRDEVTLRLQEQPLQVLLLLIARGGDIVTREELQRLVWPDETVVEVDRGLNSIVKRLRDVLGDNAESPLFIQTLPRRGYRLLVPVERIESADADAHADPLSTPTAIVAPPAAAARAPVVSDSSRPRRQLACWIATAVVILLAVGVILVRRFAGGRVASQSSGQVRLAVLPFENLTGNEEQQFFADGLHEEMIFRLGRMEPRRLAVIARTSVMPYRNATKSIAAIGRELGVDYVLEGSVRHAGERFRITAQLIRADDQSHLWTETYDRSWSDIFAIQSNVAAHVADSLAVTLLPSSEAAETHGTVTPASHEHYLKGRFYWNQRTRDPASQLARAIDEFHLAIAAQPDYALAYAGLADSHNSIFFANPGAGAASYSSARDAIQRALQLDPRLAGAYSTRAWMTLHFEHDLARADADFQRALELEPSDPLARFRYSHLLAIRGRLQDAEREAETARRYDPLSAPITDILAWFAYYRGDDARALQRMQDAAELEGNPARSHVFAAYLHAVGGRCNQALPELRPWAFDPDALRMGESAFARARCGGADANQDLRQTLEARRLTYSTAMFHFGRGEMAAFYDAVNRAIDQRFPEPLYLGVDPAFARVRGTPQFQAVLRRVGL